MRATEQRDDVMLMLRRMGVPRKVIAERFGLTVASVSTIVVRHQRRRERKRRWYEQHRYLYVDSHRWSENRWQAFQWMLRARVLPPAATLTLLEVAYGGPR